MHPIERLRYVARAAAPDLAELVQEAALALAGFADDPAALVTACRSLVDRHPAAGPVWWLAARVLLSADPAGEAWEVVEEVEADSTPLALYRDVPDGATVLVVGWPHVVARALGRRGDCRLLVVDAACAFGSPVDRLLGRGLDAEDVPEWGIGAAAASADLVVVEAQAMGADEPVVGCGLVAASGGHAAAAVATALGKPAWAVAPRGRVLPTGLWRVLAARVAETPRPWQEPDELVPLHLFSGVVRPSGVLAPGEAVAEADCRFAPELVRPLDAPGSHR